MGLDTKIEWASAGLGRGATWNPVRARNRTNGKQGWYCEKVSPACDNCYAERQNIRTGASGGTGIAYKPGLRPAVEIYLDDKAAWQPLRMGTARGIFVCSMTDLFGPFVPEMARIVVMGNAVMCPGHRFLLLTKRSAQMRIWLEDWKARLEAANPWVNHPGLGVARLVDLVDLAKLPDVLPNVWCGATVEDQRRADERTPELMATKTALRFFSCEPLLGPIDMHGMSPDWIIIGDESGVGARPTEDGWRRGLIAQAEAAGVPVFDKQRVVAGKLQKLAPFDGKVRAAYPQGAGNGR